MIIRSMKRQKKYSSVETPLHLQQLDGNEIHEAGTGDLATPMSPKKKPTVYAPYRVQTDEGYRDDPVELDGTGHDR